MAREEERERLRDKKGIGVGGWKGGQGRGERD